MMFYVRVKDSEGASTLLKHPDGGVAGFDSWEAAEEEAQNWRANADKARKYEVEER